MNLLAKVSKDGTVEAYVWALGKIVGYEKIAGTQRTRYYTATDIIGSVTATTDQTGALVGRREYADFGSSGMDGAGNDASLEWFTGKEWDADAGLYYFNARWYDPELGRFTTEDSVRDGNNWYAYVLNNPLANTDPTGLEMIYGPNGPEYYYSPAEKRITSYSSNAVRSPEQAAEMNRGLVLNRDLGAVTTTLRSGIEGGLGIGLCLGFSLDLGLFSVKAKIDLGSISGTFDGTGNWDNELSKEFSFGLSLGPKSGPNASLGFTAKTSIDDPQGATLFDLWGSESGFEKTTTRAFTGGLSVGGVSFGSDENGGLVLESTKDTMDEEIAIGIQAKFGLDLTKGLTVFKEAIKTVSDAFTAYSEE